MFLAVQKVVKRIFAFVFLMMVEPLQCPEKKTGRHIEQMDFILYLERHQGPVARRMVSANHWLIGIETYPFQW